MALIVRRHVATKMNYRNDNDQKTAPADILTVITDLSQRLTASAATIVVTLDLSKKYRNEGQWKDHLFEKLTEGVIVANLDDLTDVHDRAPDNNKFVRRFWNVALFRDAYKKAITSEEGLNVNDLTRNECLRLAFAAETAIQNGGQQQHDHEYAWKHALCRIGSDLRRFIRLTTSASLSNTERTQYRILLETEWELNWVNLLCDEIMHPRTNLGDRLEAVFAEASVDRWGQSAGFVLSNLVCALVMSGNWRNGYDDNRGDKMEENMELTDEKPSFEFNDALKFCRLQARLHEACAH